MVCTVASPASGHVYNAVISIWSTLPLPILYCTTVKCSWAVKRLSQIQRLECIDKKLMRFSIKFSGILSAICRNQSFGDICGSLGQGTIVHEHYDIDLVLYSTSKLMYKILNKNWAELYAAIMYSHDLGLLPHIRDPMENGYDDILKQLNE